LVLCQESGKVEVAVFEESRIVLDTSFLRDFEMNRRFWGDGDFGVGDFTNGVKEVGSRGEVVIWTWDAVG
jgi:sugar phosphate isomerase/epimerase